MPGVGPPSYVGFADMDKSLIQTAPYFFRDDRNPAYLANMFAGQSIFLLCGGPSLASTDSARLRDAQVMSCAVNNAAVLYCYGPNCDRTFGRIIAVGIWG